MKLTDDHVRAMAEVIGLRIPDDDLPLVTSRLAGILEEMDLLEREYGDRLDDIDPVPSVLISEEALR